MTEIKEKSKAFEKLEILYTKKNKVEINGTKRESKIKKSKDNTPNTLMSNPNIEINDKFYGSNNKFRDYSKVDTIYEIKNGLYKGLSDNEIVEKVGKDYDRTGTNYRDAIEATMMLDNDNSLKGFIKNNIGKGATSSAITAIVLNYLLKKGVSKAVAIKISPLVAGTIFAIDEVSKLKEFRNIGSNGRAALILALGKEKERGIEAAKTARWYQKKIYSLCFL